MFLSFPEALQRKSWIFPCVLLYGLSANNKVISICCLVLIALQWYLTLFPKQHPISQQASLCRYDPKFKLSLDCFFCLLGSSTGISNQNFRLNMSKTMIWHYLHISPSPSTCYLHCSWAPFPKKFLFFLFIYCHTFNDNNFLGFTIPGHHTGHLPCQGPAQTPLPPWGLISNTNPHGT